MLLVRHGESTWNADGRWQGQADPPLSELGEQQAAEAAHARRSRSTRSGRPTSCARGTPPRSSPRASVGLECHVRLDPRLRERDAGEWQGHTRAEIEEQWPGYLASGRRPPGLRGATTDLAARVSKRSTRSAARTRGSRCSSSSHGGVVRTLERHFGDDLDGLLPNLGGRWLDWSATPQGWSFGRPRVAPGRRDGRRRPSRSERRAQTVAGGHKLFSSPMPERAL